MPATMWTLNTTAITAIILKHNRMMVRDINPVYNKSKEIKP